VTSQRHTDFNGTVQFGRMSDLTMSNIPTQVKARVYLVFIAKMV